MPVTSDPLLACRPEAASLAQALWCAIRLCGLHAPLLFFAFRLAGRWFRDEATARFIAALTIYFLTMSLGCWLCPRLSLPWLLAWSWTLGAGAWGLKPPPAADRRTGAIAAAPCGGAAAVMLVTASIAALGISSPRFDHDPLTYQLHFPAAWLHAGRITIVPTVFGDPSQAYGPALASTFYLWLMAPLESDLLAVTGGWAFLVLALLGAAGLARELGARAGSAWSGAMFALMAPLFVDEGRAAFSDLAVAAFFSAALYFLIRAVKTKRAADLGFGVAAAGLMIGSKYTALLLLVPIVPLLALAAARVRGREAVGAWAAGIAAGTAGGGVWYLRNFWLSGNPVFPIRVTIAGHELLPGLYGRAEMLDWVFHREGGAAWLDVARTNASPGLLLVGAAAMLWGGTVGLQRARQRPSDSPGQSGTARIAGLLLAYVCLIPLCVDRLNWHVGPYQMERFWIPAIPVLAGIAGAVWSPRRRLLFAGLGLGWAGLFAMPTPDTTDTFTWRWLAAGLPVSGVLGWLAAAADRRFTAAGHARTQTSRFVAVLAGALLFLLLPWALRSYEVRRAARLDAFKYGPAWSMLPCPDAGVTVAYTGANVPYPLHGPRLRNRVLYISSGGDVSPRDHELVQAMRGARLPKFLTPEPMLSNLRLCPRQWARALVGANVDFLFVMRLMKYGTINVAHDALDWPLEESWARAVPELFAPYAETPLVRIYRIDRTQWSRLDALSDQCAGRPADAISACAQSPAACREYFPLADQVLRTLKRRHERPVDR